MTDVDNSRAIDFKYNIKTRPKEVHPYQCDKPMDQRKDEVKE